MLYLSNIAGRDLQPIETKEKEPVREGTGSFSGYAEKGVRGLFSGGVFFLLFA
jgi:hypothetical protein